jgi:hypothetical protein
MVQMEALVEQCVHDTQCSSRSRALHALYLSQTNSYNNSRVVSTWSVSWDPFVTAQNQPGYNTRDPINHDQDTSSGSRGRSPHFNKIHIQPGNNPLVPQLSLTTKDITFHALP